MQRTFVIDTEEFKAKFLDALKDGYLCGRINVIPNILQFVVYPNKTHIIVRLEEKDARQSPVNSRP